ncbi:MAG: hypothetical protein Q8O64_02445 [Sideroxyarcus sp.]|nr:hypothetical protein [Sideroxyarcus sp.]
MSLGLTGPVTWFVHADLHSKIQRASFVRRATGSLQEQRAAAHLGGGWDKWKLASSEEVWHLRTSQGFRLDAEYQVHIIKQST